MATIRRMPAPTVDPNRRVFHWPQATVPVDEVGAFVDCGRWRAKGVTHWHLVYEEWQLSENNTRFSNDRVRVAMLRRDEVACTPQEALDWLEKSCRDVVARCGSPDVLLRSAGLLSEYDWWSLAETSFFELMHGHQASVGLLVAPGRTADSNAYPMTAALCTACTT